MPDPQQDRPPVKAPVYGQRMMAVTGHSSATLSALHAFQAGGNVVDAAIAASATLSAVLGQATTIGGDCFVLYHDAAASKTFGLNASGVAPQRATPEVFSGGMTAIGPRAAVVPGLVRAWGDLHARFGRANWSGLFDGAIAAAEAHPVSYILATRLSPAAGKLLADPGCNELYFTDGVPLQLGATLRQPALAATLRRLADQGVDEFYQGETAAKIVAAFDNADGLITAPDLQSYETLWVEPITTLYRGHRVSVMPPNSCGALLLMQLDGLAAVPSEAFRSDPELTMAYQMSAMKAAFANGVDLIGDPMLLPNAGDQLLNEDMKQRMREAVLQQSQAGRITGSGGTACVLIADAEGNMIIIVQSIYNVFGSVFLDPATGILFNNRMQDFSDQAGLPKSVGPRRRPFHTLCPIMVHDGEGRPRYALASPGGISQTLTGAQLLVSLLDKHYDVAAAVEAPRWCNRKDGDFLIDPSFPEDMARALRGMGHQVRRGGDPYFYGSAKAIEWLPTGNLAGAGDHRREAFALGV